MNWLNSPEFNVAIFSFLLSFFWEIQQMWFYHIPAGYSHFDIVRNCTLATVGDVVVMLISFWIVAVLSKSRQWLRHPNPNQISVFILVGVVITVVIEALATGLLSRWTYAESMPTIPILGTGLVPLSMWFIVPPLTIRFARRQILPIRS
nr:hypothetical protein [Nodosilinea sp. LEGE 06152]